MYTGIIYKCFCSTTNKYYIGLTILPFNCRKRDHIKDAFNINSCGYNFYFHRALRKYGLENFIWNIVETINLDSKDELITKLNELEILYIKQYNSYNDGYNLTLGGNNSTKKSRAIIGYSIKGDIIYKFNSCLEAATTLNMSKNTIRNCLTHKITLCRVNYVPIIFLYADEKFEIPILSLKTKLLIKNINVYTVNQELIQSFNSISEAAKYYNCSRSMIFSCCNKLRAFVQINYIKYIFRYDGDICTKEDCLRAEKINSPKCKIEVLTYETNKIIGIYNSISEASRQLHVSSTCLQRCSTKERLYTSLPNKTKIIVNKIM